MDIKTSRNFTLYPLAIFAFSFAIGIFISSRAEAPWYAWLIATGLFGTASLGFKGRYAATAFLCLAFISAGGMLAAIEKGSVASNRLKRIYEERRIESGEPVEITGVLLGKPELTVGGSFLLLESEALSYKGAEQKVSGRARLFAPADDEGAAAAYERLDLGYGSRIRVACLLRREDKYQNPGVTPTTYILDHKDIDATATIKSHRLAEKIGEAEIFLPLAWLYERRQGLILDFKKTFSVSTSGVLIASLLGNRYHLDRPSADRFREGGTFHLVVISGLHITFIGWLSISIIRRFTKNRWIQFIAASGFLWSYAMAVGAEAPVVRAAIMFTGLQFAIVVFRQGTLLNALGISSLLLLAWKPSELFDISFQLTFICVLSIIGMGFPILERLKAIGSWRPSSETPFPPNCSQFLKSLAESLYWSQSGWEKEKARNIWSCNFEKSSLPGRLESLRIQSAWRIFFETMVVSLIVQVWLLPWLILNFHRLSIASFLMNIWAGYAIAIESLSGIASIFIAKLSPLLAKPFILATEALNWLVVHGADPLIEIGYASLRIPHYAETARFIYPAYFLPVIALAFLIAAWKPFALRLQPSLSVAIAFAFACLLALASIMLLHPFSAPAPAGKLRIDFLDVGQGDSALVTFPSGETLLIDGGGRPKFSKTVVSREGAEPEVFEPDIQNIGESVVSEFLWEKGYSSIDIILGTHADADHVQGLADVSGNFTIGEAIFGRMPMDNPDFYNVYQKLTKWRVPIKFARKGEKLQIGGAEIEFLHPKNDDSGEILSSNNLSVVFRLTYGNTSFLFTGDIEKEIEKELLSEGAHISTDLIKVAHHGSKTSSTQEFTEASGAKLAIISVGKESPFSHPHPEVVERWQRKAASVETTGSRGCITIISDGNSISLSHFK